MKKTSAKQVLADNLSSLRDTDGVPKGARALAERIGIGENTIGRARRGDGNITIDNVEAIAREYKMEAWQLLARDPLQRPAAGMRTVTIEPTQRVHGMQLPKSAVDFALAWMALPERERNEFKRAIEAAAAPHRDPAQAARVKRTRQAKGSALKPAGNGDQTKPEKATLKPVPRSK
jgi:transcriptional regulator with XRE-family HTH domain